MTDGKEGAALPGRMRGRPAPAGPPRQCTTAPGAELQPEGGDGQVPLSLAEARSREKRVRSSRPSLPHCSQSARVAGQLPREARGAAHSRSRHWSALLRGGAIRRAAVGREWAGPWARALRLAGAARAMVGWGSFYRGEGLEEEEEQQQEEEEGSEAVGKGPPPPHGGQIGAHCLLSRLHGRRRGRC